jgi:aqualysin 1
MKKKLISSALVTAILLSGCGSLNDSVVKNLNSNSTRILTETPINIIPDQYIVVLKEGAESEALISSLEQGEATKTLGLGSGTLKVDQIYQSALLGFSGQLDSVMLEALKADPRVDYIEEDQVMEINTTQPNPTWGLDRIDQPKLPLNNSYNYNTTATGVNVYVIDTGIRASHSEFTGRIGNGFDAVNSGGTANDCNGHGTHVAGTIGGTTYGVAKGVTLHPVRVLNCAGSGTNSGVIAGINWVKRNHSKPAVANMSLGGGASRALDRAVTNAIRSGITFAVAAGNSNGNACSASPARTPNAITVGATTTSDARSSFSNYGTCLDVFAPGSDILSAFNTSDTATQIYSGTSMASPHVAGVAALFLANNPTATPEEVRNNIVATASANVISDAGPGSLNLLVNLPTLRNADPSPDIFSSRFWVNIKDQPANPWNTNSGKAMTWVGLEDQTNVVLVGSDGLTNAYSGDTDIKTELPILCLNVDNSPKPDTIQTSFYKGWSFGRVLLSKPVTGTTLTSVEAANTVCADQFGTDWRMAEFHDGFHDGSRGGWSFYANRDRFTLNLFNVYKEVSLYRLTTGTATEELVYQGAGAGFTNFNQFIVGSHDTFRVFVTGGRPNIFVRWSWQTGIDLRKTGNANPYIYRDNIGCRGCNSDTAAIFTVDRGAGNIAVNYLNPSSR